MNYHRIYNNIINTAKYRGLNKTNLTYYVESHHIIPRSIGGDNSEDNLVLLTPKEHYICHHLLYKIYANKSMCYAYKMMSHFARYNMKLTEYERNVLGMQFSRYLSNKKLSDATKLLLSNNRKNAWAYDINYRNRMIEIFNSIKTKKKHSDATKQWILNNKSEFNKKMLKINTNISKITKTANAHKGMKRSDSSKLLMSKSAIGKHEGKSNGIWNGYYITPLGKFERVYDVCNAHNIKACTVHNRCKYNNKSIIKAQALRNADVIPEYIGKTWHDLGWGFIGESNG
jgi:hypothetical protein